MDNNTATTLLTVITESSLESKLTQTLLEYGAKGYTVTDARGSGARGVRTGNWDEESNIRVEVICSAEVAEKLEHCLEDKFYKDYAMVLFSQPVHVLRPNKF